MSRLRYHTLEIRFVIEDWRTRVYVLMEEPEGTEQPLRCWRAKDFPAEFSVADIIKKVGEGDHPADWYKEAPEAQEITAEHPIKS